MSETPNKGLLEIDEEDVVSTKTFAQTIGVTVRRVQQMIQDGTVKTSGKGRLPLFDNVQRYVSFMTGNMMTEEEKKIEKGRKSAETKLKVAKAEKAVLELNELKGKMHRSEDVEALTQDMCDAIRNGLLALPGRLAVDVSLCDSAEECSAIIRDCVHELLEELSNYRYDPAKYEEKVREREKLSEKPEDDDE